MIGRKKIILFSIILAVLIVCTVFTLVFVKVSDDKSNTATEPDTNVNISDADESLQAVDIFIDENESLNSFEIIIPGETLKFYSPSKYIWLLEGLEQSKTNTSKTYNVFNFLNNLRGKSLVEENASDLKKYGLDNPQYIINATYGNESITFSGGNITPLDDGYYFKTSKSNSIYTLYKSDFEILFSDSYFYRHIPNFNFADGTVKKITVIKNDSVLEIQSMEQPIYVNNVLYADWEMLQPSYNTLDIKMVSENILEKIPYIALDQVVKDDSVDEKLLIENQYASVIIENKVGNKNTFYLTPCDANTFYVRVDDDPWIYLAYVDRFSFIDVPHFLLVDKFLHFFALL